MRELFAGYYRPSNDDFEKIWAEGLICLDANVLLNLYRYPQEACNQLLEALEGFRGRIWVPYQAALEFHRNRAAVIAEQRGKFQKVRNVVESARSKLRADLNEMKLKERHSTIDPDDFLKSFDAICSDFSGAISQQETQHLDVFSDDPLIARVVDLLEGQVGHRPDQAWINETNKWAEERYKSHVPPGYRDLPKKESDRSSYGYDGLVYQSVYGDALVWKQILDHADKVKPSALIFVTDDKKDDWWYVVDSAGDKTLGPRPELVKEMTSIGVPLFYMYRTYRFLESAKEHLKSDVSAETIEHVKDVSSVDSAESSLSNDARYSSHLVEKFLSDKFPGYKISEEIIPDFAVYDPILEEKHAFEFFSVLRIQTFATRLNVRFSHLQEYCPASEWTTRSVIAVCPNLQRAGRVLEELSEIQGLIAEDGIEVIICYVADDSDKSHKLVQVI